MSVLTTVKQLSIATRLYRPARWLSRRLRPHRWRAFLEDVNLYATVLPPGALCFDVGANKGEKSEALLRAGAGRVVAFEPNPRVIPELRARCAHWKNWLFIEAAVGKAVAVAMLYSRESHAESSLSPDSDGTHVIGTHYVPVVTLDAAIACFGRPAYCKIDVEGWELEVLRGLSTPIPLISFEFHLKDKDIRKTLACLDRLSQFGPCRVNLTPAETSSFHFEQWMPLERFLRWFPGDLRQSLPGYPYGDIFVWSDGA